mmetsp:Transcript_6149/g.24793  ORF Transcript_6149/g.24793 Transcript_6149/m.24793 type:complete len:276 (-) Transcript_6149:620-1447(-)
MEAQLLGPCLEGLSDLAERVCLSVENIVVQGNDVVVGEDEVEILERLGEEEALHCVVVVRVHVVHVTEARVAVIQAAVLLDVLVRLPGVVAEALVVRRAPEHKVTLDHLRAKEVVLSTRRNDELASVGELEHLWADASGGAVVGLVAGGGDLGAHVQLLASIADGMLVGAKCEHAAREAGEMLHLLLYLSAPSNLAHELVSGGRCLDEGVEDALHGLLVHAAVAVCLLVCEQPKLQFVLVEAVSQSSHAHFSSLELSRPRVHVQRVEAVVLLEAV